MNIQYELYKINAEIQRCIDPETGEINEGTFNALAMAREEKLEQLALLCKNLRANTEMIKAEKAALQERIDKNESTLEKCEELLKSELNGELFETAKVVVKFRKSESVNVLDMSRVPADYLKPQPPKADKNAIKAALKAGNTVDGCELIRSLSMSIK